MAENTNKSPLRVGIIGMGPIGSILAANLVDAGAFVIACDIDRAKIDMIKEAGIKIEGKIEKHVRVAGGCYSLQELDGYDLDIIGIAVKAFNLKKVVSLLSESGSKKSFVMCAQNGLDNELEVSGVCGEDRTLRMVVNYGGAMTSPNTVRMTFFNSPNYIAPLSPCGKAMASRITSMLSSVNLKTEAPGDIRSFIWEKSILNSAMAHGAIAQLTMKQVMDSPEAVEIVKAIIDESVCVAEAEGIKFRENFREFSLKYLESGGHHRPSMAVDLGNGCKTEIDYLNGRIAEYGRKHGIPTPYNRIVTILIHLIEQSLPNPGRQPS